MCYLLFAYRVKPHDSTGESPFFLLYGRDAHLPTETALSTPRTPYQVDTEDYRTSLMEGLTTAWKNARLKINSAQQRYKTQYDKRSKTCQYQVGDRVFIYMPTEQQGKLRKLARPFFGPYRIEAVTLVLSELFLLIVLEQNRSLSIWIVYDHVTERYLTLRRLEKRREPGSENWTVMLPVDTLQRNSTAISGKFKTRQATTTFVHIQHEDVLSLRARNCNDPHT